MRGVCTTSRPGPELPLQSFSIHGLNGEGSKGIKEGGATRWREPGSLSDCGKSLLADGYSATERWGCLLQQQVLLILINTEKREVRSRALPSCRRLQKKEVSTQWYLDASCWDTGQGHEPILSVTPVW